MSTTARKILAVALAVTLGGLVAAYEPHRHLIAAVWPTLTDIFNYLTA